MGKFTSMTNAVYAQEHIVQLNCYDNCITVTTVNSSTPFYLFHKTDVDRLREAYNPEDTMPYNPDKFIEILYPIVQHAFSIGKTLNIRDVANDIVEMAFKATYIEPDTKKCFNDLNNSDKVNYGMSYIDKYFLFDYSKGSFTGREPQYNSIKRSEYIPSKTIELEDDSPER